METTYRGVFQGVQKRRMAWKKKGFFSMELTICIVVAMLLMVMALVAYPEYKNNANRTAAMQDMKTLKAAVVSYCGLSISNQPPANLGVLLSNPSLQAADAIDGVDHGPFLEAKRGWTTDASSIKDPWGNTYQYAFDATTKEGTITTTGGGSQPMSISF